MSGLPAKFGVTRLDDGVLKSICNTNMRFARVASVLGLIVAAYVVVYDFVIEHGALTLAQPAPEIALRCLMCAVLVGASVAVFVVAHRFLHGSGIKPTTAQRVLAAYAVVAVGVAMLLFVIDYPVRNQALVFIVAELVCTSAFIISPAIGIPLLVVGFTVVFNALSASGDSLLVPFAGRALFVLMLCALTFMRYNAAVEEATRHEKARSVSMVDELTGIMNRMFLRSDFEQHIGKRLVVMMCDLDDFKHYNDVYGHATGDRIIRSYAEALRGEFGRRQSYRYGGDEFLVISTDPLDEFEAKLERLREKTSAIDVNDFEQSITMSCGYCTGTPLDNQQLRNMIEVADRELYIAKRSGKNCVEHVAYDERLLEVGFGGSGVDAYRSRDLDPLTGLVNMAYFRNRAARILENRKARERGLAYVYFNLANFKSFNNSHGFDAGDQLLKRCARALEAAFPGYLVSRFAEDKFSVLCLNEALEQRIAQAQQAVRDCQRDTSVELRAGIYLVDDEAADVNMAHDRARLACDSIRGRYDVFFRYFDDELSSQYDKEQFIISNLELALKRGDIRVYFQPIVRTITGAIYGFEALTRWVDPDLGLISPADFVPVLERARLTHRLDQFVIASVCKQMRALRDSGAPWINVSVNLSRRDFVALDIPRLVRETTNRYRIPRRALNIEITESAFVDAERNLYDAVASLRSMGYSVWMDDFGSGYSSLGNLKEQNFDLIKIDMGFLRDFNPDAKSNEILASVIDMIKRLGTGCLIEGVETQEQLDFVSAVGCEFIQGYLFGKPRPFEWYLSHLNDYQVETIESRGYYDNISRMNPVSPVPFDYDQSDAPGEKGLVSSIALAVVELKGDIVDYLWANRAYEDILASIGHDSLAVSARWVNEKRGDIKRFLKNTVRADGLRTIDFMGGGQHFTLRAKTLSSGDASAAVLVSLSGVVESGERESVEYDVVAEYMLSTFSRVDLVNLTTRQITNIYLSHTLARHDEYLETTEEDAKRAVASLVYPADRARYLEFCDLDTLEERMRRCEEPYLSDVFRMRDDEGLYGWNELVEVPLQIGGRAFAISGVRHASTSAMSRYAEPAKSIPHAELWESYIDLAQVGIFWKDAQRRFLGANRYFLDYYGMESVDEIVGKTDEDLGWHVDEGPSRCDELRVLNGHETLRDVPGHCISHGRDRAIRASKAPILENGTAKGLVGHFVDVEQHRERERGATAPQPAQDALELQDFAVMEAQLLSFADSFAQSGRDFVFAYLAIGNLQSLNDAYGEQFEDEVLGLVARRIDAVCGNSAVLTHAKGTWFALAAHVDGMADAVALVERVAASVRAVDAVEGLPCALDVLTGSARYEETKSLLKLVQTAEDRLFDMRHVDDALALRPETTERVSRQDIARRMKILSGYFDRVTLVQPKRFEAYSFDRESGKVGVVHECYKHRGSSTRCDDCAALRALTSQKDQMRTELVDGATRVTTFKNIVVDGYPMVLVLELDLPELAAPASGVASTSQDDGDIWYCGPEAGVYNRRYFDAYLLKQEASKVAKLDMDKYSLVGSSFGEQAADRGLRRVAALIESLVGQRGIVAHYRMDQFVIVFFETMSTEEYHRALADIVAGIEGLTFELHPNLRLHASIGATQRDGVIEDLVHEADWLMYQAKTNPKHIVVG